jgi:protease IV
MEENTMPSNQAPPPAAQPPPFSPPPPPPRITAQAMLAAKPRKSIGWMIAALVLFCLLVLSGLMNLGSLFDGLLPSPGSMNRAAGPRMQEVVLKAAATRDKIMVIPLSGIIMGQSVDGSGFNMVDLIREQLKRAGEDERVKAVVLKIDSPGGEVMASDDIYQALLKFQSEHKKPVVASMGTLAASGGYYVSAPCQWIVANEMTITGSIGVIMSTFNYRGLMDKIGLKPEVFKSGKYKDMLRGSKQESEITDQERKMIQDLIDETFQRFKSVVLEGRKLAAERNSRFPEKGRALDPAWADSADGRIFSGKEALRLGFVDELGNFEAAVRRAKTLAGIRQAMLVEHQPVFDLSNLLRLFGKTEFGSVKVDMGLDLPKLKMGQLYFLSPTFVH